MQDWTDGYVTDVAYTFGYYGELNPLRARLALLNAGVAPPDVGTACELGFGQGVSINAHAAASSVEWHGTDFNPAQAGFARELAGGAALAGRLHDAAFEAFCQRSDLPDFDFIGLHGIWSWISDANRAVIAGFVQRKLKVGGVLYISYNTQPGWAALAPLRDLLIGYNDTLAAPGTASSKRIGASLDFAERLLESGALYGKANPAALAHIKQLRSQNPNYLAHEYFNRDWTPMPFARMAEWMASLKLTFAGSANYLDHVDILHLSADQRALLAEIPDRSFRETARDFLVNQRFRRDYWVRGARRLTPFEQSERIRAQRVVLVEAADQVKLRVIGALGEATLDEAVYRPMIDAMADHQVRTIGAIEAVLAPGGASLGKVIQAVTILVGNGAVHVAQEAAAVQHAQAGTDALNRHLCQLARYSNDVAYLASPVTGGAIVVSRFEQLFLMAGGLGLAAPAEWARHVAALFTAQGQRVVKEGKTIESADDQLAELTRQADTFAERRLPVLKALGVAT
jgi:hypothetical protein